MKYISHPYGGLEENKEQIEKIITALQTIYPSETFISPVHCFGFLYDTLPYADGLKKCIDLLLHCDAMLVFGNWISSKGCCEEIRQAKLNNIPYAIINERNGLSNCDECFYCDRCENEENCRRLRRATLGAKLETTLSTRIECKDFINEGEIDAGKRLTEGNW